MVCILSVEDHRQLRYGQRAAAVLQKSKGQIAFAASVNVRLIGTRKTTPGRQSFVHQQMELGNNGPQRPTVLATHARRGCAVMAGSESGGTIQAGVFQITSPVEAIKDQSVRIALPFTFVGWAKGAKRRAHAGSQDRVGFASLSTTLRRKKKGSGTPTDAYATNRTQRGAARATFVRVTTYERFGRARLSAFHRGTCGSERTPPLNSSHALPGSGVIRCYLHLRLSQSSGRFFARRPVIVPVGRLHPEPPGSEGDKPSPAGTALAPSFGSHRRRP
jgi:hypothetical protein